MKNTEGLPCGGGSQPSSTQRLCGMSDEPQEFLSGCSHAQTLMWAYGVMEFYGLGNERSDLFKGFIPCIEEPAVLYRIVHSLGQCVVQRVSRLCHAYPDAGCF